MGTRADFYVGRGIEAEWLGSIAWDGYPAGITPNEEATAPAYHNGPDRHVDGEWPEGAHLFDAITEAEYRERVGRFFQYREDATRPADGWPWPWEDSQTTDYAYAFDGGKVWASCFGHEWFDPNAPEPDDEEIRSTKPTLFPNMKARANVAMPGTNRSGMMVIEVPIRGWVGP